MDSYGSPTGFSYDAQGRVSFTFDALTDQFGQSVPAGILNIILRAKGSTRSIKRTIDLSMANDG